MGSAMKENNPEEIGPDMPDVDKTSKEVNKTMQDRDEVPNIANLNLPVTDHEESEKKIINEWKAEQDETKEGTVGSDLGDHGKRKQVVASGGGNQESLKKHAGDFGVEGKGKQVVVFGEGNQETLKKHGDDLGKMTVLRDQIKGKQVVVSDEGGDVGFFSWSSRRGKLSVDSGEVNQEVVVSGEVNQELMASEEVNQEAVVSGVVVNQEVVVSGVVVNQEVVVSGEGNQESLQKHIGDLGAEGQRKQVVVSGERQEFKKNQSDADHGNNKEIGNTRRESVDSSFSPEHDTTTASVDSSFYPEDDTTTASVDDNEED